MANILIGIHGLANKPPKDTLSEWWEAAIREGLSKNCDLEDADFQYEMVFWADLVHDPLQAAEGHRQPYTKAPPGPLREHVDSWRDGLRGRLQAAIGSFIDRTRRFLPIGLIVNPILRNKLHDLDYHYERSRKIKDRNGRLEVARKVLMEELMKTVVNHRGDRVMLIAHSMGSIIAYDVLRDLGQEDDSFEVLDFVTIGSPLGLSTVKANIRKERSGDAGVSTPEVVRRRWANYADFFDPVAVDTHLGDDYEVNESDVGVEDNIVDNPYVGVDGRTNHHKSYGYLKDARAFPAHRRVLGQRLRESASASRRGWLPAWESILEGAGSVRHGVASTALPGYV